MTGPIINTNLDISRIEQELYNADVTTLNASPPEESDFNSPPRRPPVLAAIIIVLVAIVVILGWLLYRAVSIPEPTRVLIVTANRDWDGVGLSIEGNQMDKKEETRINFSGNYKVPFFLWPGKYTLHVKSQGQEILTREFDLTEPRIQEFDLPKSGATTRPTPQP